MRRFLLFSLIAFAVVAQQPATAKSSPTLLSRVGPWQMNYDIDSCHLQATFGTGDQEILFDITRVTPSDDFDLLLVGKQVASNQRDVPVKVAFGSNPIAIERNAIAGMASVPIRRPLLMIDHLRIDGRSLSQKELASPPKITPADEAMTSSITLTLPLGRSYQFDTKSLGAPFSALRRCTADLVKSWGYDPFVQSGLIKKVEMLGKAEDWLSSNDYPFSANERLQSGRVSVRLDVDETGKVSGCRVLFRTNPDSFADLTCQLLSKRAKFSPALAADGKPVKSYLVRVVKWLIP